MGVLDQLSNTVVYQIHKATYDPEAENYAVKVAKQKESEAAATVAAKKAEADAAEKKKMAEAAEAEKAKTEAEQKERETFDSERLIGRVFGTVGTILLVFLVLAFGVFGASLATNLNLYRSAPFRILYAIYGFLFFWIVIPYVLLYRWWWQGQRPRFYALLPIIPYHLDHPWAALLFSWLSYKPDDRIAALKEWEGKA
jgi:cation transport ATPase